MSAFQLHPEASAEIDDLWDFIASDNLDAADTVVNELFNTIQAIADFPHIGHRRADLTQLPIRFITCFSYLIAYVPDGRPVWVLAVFHGSRHPRLLAQLLQERKQEQDRQLS